MKDSVEPHNELNIPKSSPTHFYQPLKHISVKTKWYKTNVEVLLPRYTCINICIFPHRVKRDIINIITPYCNLYAKSTGPECKHIFHYLVFKHGLCPREGQKYSDIRNWNDPKECAEFIFKRYYKAK